jgi:periplasmic divalent cation tolerance protein
MNADDFIVIMSTVSSQIEAGQIGEDLISKKLAACVNVIPGVTSYYRWSGEAQIGRELIVLVKTLKENYEKVQEIIKEHHSYELPEIIAMPIVAGDDKYLRWIDGCSRK